MDTDEARIVDLMKRSLLDQYHLEGKTLLIEMQDRERVMFLRRIAGLESLIATILQELPEDFQTLRTKIDMEFLEIDKRQKEDKESIDEFDAEETERLENLHEARRQRLDAELGNRE